MHAHCKMNNIIDYNYDVSCTALCYDNNYSHNNIIIIHAFKVFSRLHSMLP